MVENIAKNRSKCQSIYSHTASPGRASFPNICFICAQRLRVQLKFFKAKACLVSAKQTSSLARVQADQPEP